MDDYHSIQEFEQFLISPALLQAINKPLMDTNMKELSMNGFLRLYCTSNLSEAMLIWEIITHRGFKGRIFSKVDEMRYNAILENLKWLQTVALSCDGLCYLISQSFDTNKLCLTFQHEMNLDRQISRCFHNLLLSLMADQSFKLTVAVAYASSYRKLCHDFSEGAGIHGTTLYNLSVQFLNRELFVHEISYHHNFLSEATSALCDCLNVSNQSQEGYFKLMKIRKRRYSPIIGDLKVLGHILIPI